MGASHQKKKDRGETSTSYAKFNSRRKNLLCDNKIKMGQLHIEELIKTLENMPIIELQKLDGEKLSRLNLLLQDITKIVLLLNKQVKIGG